MSADKKLDGSAQPLAHVRPGYRAQPPEPPALPPGQQKADGRWRQALRERESVERASMLRGLMWLAILILLVSFARAGLGRVFVHGWWRQW